MWRSKPKPKTREELFADAELAEKEYDLNPHDPEKLKSWTSALLDAVCTFNGDAKQDMPFLYAAKSKLEKVLDIEKDDHYTMFELGDLCYHILEWDPDINVFDKDYKTIHDQAVKLFQEVKLKAPSLYEGSDMLKILARIKPLESSEPLSCDDDYDDYVDNDGLASRQWFKQTCKDAEDLFSRGAHSFKTLSSWGFALMGLAYYSYDLDRKIKFTKEAMHRFQAASILEPGNIYNNRDLAEAKLLLCTYQKGNGYSELKASFDQLAKEVKEEESKKQEEEESKKRKRDS